MSYPPVGTFARSIAEAWITYMNLEGALDEILLPLMGEGADLSTTLVDPNDWEGVSLELKGVTPATWEPSEEYRSKVFELGFNVLDVAWEGVPNYRRWRPLREAAECLTRSTNWP